MKTSIYLLVLFLAFLTVGAQATIINYGNIGLSGGFQAEDFSNGYWDLTAGALTISFRLNMNGMVDNSGAHAWAELGIRQLGYGNFNPNNRGVWLATDYDYAANTFDPDPPGFPTLDMDDKLILQRRGGYGEGDYNLPSVPPIPGNNHRLWFDRDGVDQWQAASPLAIDGASYNTGGFYDIVMTLTATSPTAGAAYMTINGLNQGFETDGNWNTMELTPAGMTFSGDMTKMQIFYGLYGYGATHSVEFNNINASGYFIPEPSALLLLCTGLSGVVVFSFLRRKRR